MEHPVIRLSTFASEGPPHDQGLNLDQYKNTFLSTCTQGGASSVIGWTPRLIKERFPSAAWCVQDHPGYPLANVITGQNQNPGYERVGLGGWRAFLLSLAISEAEDGDIVIHHDCRRLDHGDNLYFARHCRQYVERVMQETDLFIPPHRYVNSQLTPRSVIEKLVPDEALAGKIANLPVCRARCVIIRVTPITRRFIRLYEDTVKDERVLLSKDQETYPNSPALKHYCVEQSILNVLAYREGLFPLNVSGTWLERWPDVGHEPGIGTGRILEHEPTHRSGS